MSGSKSQNYLHGAAILGAGVIIMKILGAIYKIPLVNILGDSGYGYFLVAYNIYNLLLTIATAGFPVALSRMISEANTLGKHQNVKKIFNVAFLTFAVLGIIGSLVMFLFPTELAIAMNQARASQSIFALAPAILFACLTSVYRGHAQGLSNMQPTTIGQVLEVLVKVIVGLVLAWVLVSRGASLPIASAGAIFGTAAGGLVALLYMSSFKRRHYSKPVEAHASEETESSSAIFKRLMRIGIPITLGASVMSLITLIDTTIVLDRLQNAVGFSEEVVDELYGVYGAIMTLYNLPAAFVTPLTISIVPAITACVTRRAFKDASDIAQASVRITSLIAMPMGVGLSVLAYPIVNVLFPTSHEAGPTLLMQMGVASIFVCIALITTAILQAHGNEKYPVYSMIVGGLIKIAVNWVLVGNPDINIYGAPIGTLVCYLVMCTMNIVFICRCMEKKPSVSGMFLRPLISTLVMGVVAWALYSPAFGIINGMGIVGEWLSIALAMIVSIGAACVVYVILIVTTRAVTLDDMKLIPKGEKLAKVLRIK